LASSFGPHATVQLAVDDDRYEALARGHALIHML
jgi:Ser-tRNA(Ala) deacylase AlaX